MRTVRVTKSIAAEDVRERDLAFAVDTAGSWDGRFPDVGKGDYLITIGSEDSGDDELVLVSRRYTEAVNHKNAAELALSAFAERMGYKTDSKGNLVGRYKRVRGFPFPAWIVEARKVI